MPLTSESVIFFVYYKGMKENYSGKEVIQIAMGEERDAIAFYKTALDSDRSASTKNLFRFLRDEEAKHLDILEKKILPFFEGDVFAWADEELISSYLRATKKSGMFQDGSMGGDFFKENRGTQEIIEFAIDMEKKSIEFYKKIWVASSAGGLEALDQLIEEEVTHIHKLKELRLTMENE